VVYGVLRTQKGLSHTVTADQVGLSLIIFVLVYTVVFGTGIYYMLKLMKSGPVHIDSIAHQPAGPGHFKTPLRPLSAVEASIDSTDPSDSNCKENPHD
jgi:cytochrome d ubiquinol oxidase subunit I